MKRAPASMLLAFLAATVPLRAAGAETARDVYAAAGIPGGVVVHLGVEDGRTVASWRTGGSFLVQGLDEDAGKVARARDYLASEGLQGPVTVRAYDGVHLPYIDNMVNIVVIPPAGCRVPAAEILRVLAPGGSAVVPKDFKLPGAAPDPKPVGDRVLRRKPVPADTDDWTHYLYDAGNNAVSKDTRIDAPRRQQWVGGPRWSRHHDHIAGMTALVSTGGRLFYVFDEGKTSSVLLPPRHFLIARDAYNGTILWKRPLPSWFPHLWPLKSGPAHLPRLLVAREKKVYLPLGMAAPLSVMDADSGDLLKTFPETKGTEEVLVADGTIFVLADPEPRRYEDFTLGDAHNGSQKGRVAKMYPWDRRMKTIVVLDEESGALRWKKQGIVAPLTLTVNGKHVLFFNGKGIVALDRKDGAVSWRSEAIKAKKLFEINESPILVAYKDTVLFAGANGLMSAYAAETGKRLWETKHERGGYCSPQDLFVIDDVVWSGAVVSPRSSGIFVGRDLKTGEPKRDIPPQKVPYTFGHHRCHRAKATTRFILASKTGIEFYDIAARKEAVNHWIRGGCLYGILPANGLIYAPMHSCACHLDSKLSGFNAVAPEADAGTERTATPRLRKGPAYAKLAEADATPPMPGMAWPTYRADNARSGATAAAVPEDLKPTWFAPLKGKLSAPTVGCGRVFVAAVDAHRLVALDPATGGIAWSFATGGRIDSPPTVYGGAVFFGCADGHLYALDAADGRLAWRFRLAPDDRQLCSYGQLESVWPVHGSVLIKDGKVFAVGGRSSFLDGGLPFVRLDARTGALEAESRLDDIDAETGKSLQLLSQHSIMPSAIPDVLVCDGGKIYMRVETLSEDGRRIGSIAFDKERQYEERHLFSWAGFLEDSWMHRLYMSYGNGKLPLGTYLNWWTYGEWNPDGRLLVMDDATIYRYGLKPKYHTWSSTFVDYQLFATPKEIGTEPLSGPSIFGKKMGRTPRQRLKERWTAEIPFYVKAMVKAADKLVLCGPEKIVDEKDVIRRYPDPGVLQTLARQDRILDGAQDCHLWVVGTKDGKVMEKHQLEHLPVWDGMAAVDGRVYLATRDGVVCLAGE